MIEIFKDTRFDFIGKRRYFFVFSTILVLIGLAAVVQIYRGRANLGIDFSGGMALQLKLDKPLLIERVREALGAKGFSDAEIQEFTGGDRFLVRLRKQEVGEGTPDRIVVALMEAVPDNRFVVESATEIGPMIGQKLRKDATVAIFLSLIGIILYIAVRFDFRFGLAAVAATVHDVLAVLGLFFLMNKEVTLLLVTALLTIAGYSLTDTVVVFDRIRENLRTKRRESLEEAINASINQVLSRTLNTSLTTLLAVIALYLFGGETIHDFSLALLLGIIVGTYSSWYIASPLLLLMKSDKRKAQARA